MRVNAVEGEAVRCLLRAARTGIIAWDQHHNSTGGFELTGYQPNGNLPQVATI